MDGAVILKTIGDAALWLLRNIIWINIILAGLVVFFERRNPKSTWLWLMVLTFLPGIGFILYLVLGQDLSKKKIFVEKRKEDHFVEDLARHQRAEISRGDFEYEDLRYKDYEYMINMHLSSSQALFTQNNQVELYYDGEAKFKALLKSINEAEEYILLQYYIIKSDGLGTAIMDALCEKAREGIKVKVLYDGMGGRFISNDSKRMMKEAGVEIAVFFPPFAKYLSLRINYRNHRKICVIDGREGYVGGFNIGDEYIGLDEKFGHWKDAHARIVGEAVSSLQWRFMLDWRFSSGSVTPSMFKSYVPSKDEEQGNVGMQIVSSGPDSKWLSIRDGYLTMMSNARDKIYIETPYFIPDDSILEALKIAAISGVDVRVMIPAKPDHPFVFWASLSYMGELLKAGVKCYAYKAGFLHSKTVIMDDFVSSVGTANMDIRSFELNFEVNAFMYDKNINKQLTDNFMSDIDNCEEITMDKYNSRSNWVKVKESFSRLLSPIL